jgi:fructan beta-fructosidase
MPLPKLLAVAAALFATVVGAVAQSEPFRPRFHFTPKINWTNDPNGLVYFDGEYHLFFQYNPFGDGWGHMSWGHAVSPDLVHWKELPVALAEEDGIMIFTGSTVVDDGNSSGFCLGGKPCLVAVYTGHRGKTEALPRLETQNIAYSNDRGRTWTKYKGNPVLDLGLPQFRDPHVFRYNGRWVMAVSLPERHEVSFYGSADLKTWQHLSNFGPAGATGGEWECPTMVELPVDGDAKRTRFVLKIGLNPGALQGGSGEQYFVGTFDGTRFVNENSPEKTLWVDSGKDCYCALVFNHAPRPTMLGWMSNWQYAGKTPTKPWRGQMTVAREIALRSTPEGLRLMQRPVTPPHRGKPLRFQGASITKLNALLRHRDSVAYEFTAAIDSPQGDSGFKLLQGAGDTYTVVGYDRAKQELYVDRTHSGATGFSPQFPARPAVKLTLNGPLLQLRILVDASSVEVFAQDGAVAITNLVFPATGATGLQFFSTAQPKRLALELWPLRD